jgi:8-oxo-dGTP pyrophosphatase MutT (NUDIX family)
VLILLAHGPAGPDVLLIQRADQLRKHAGQPAFPGGAADPDDRGPEDTALREAAEEVGLDPAGVRVVTLLPELYLAPTGFAVTPVLAWWHRPHEVGVVDPAEVARVERVPVRELTDPANRCRVRHPSGYTGPAFAVRGMLVWGFTGAVLDRLLELAGWARPWDRDDVRQLPQRALDLAARGVPPAARAAEPEPEDDGPAADDLIPSGGGPPGGDGRDCPGTVGR